MLKKTLLSVAFGVATATCTYATISVSLIGDQLQDVGGVPLQQGGLLLLVASTGNAAFEDISAGSSTAVGSALSGDDRIVYRAVITADEAGFSPGLAFKTIDSGSGGALDLSSVSGWNAGDPLALVWFPTLNSSSSLITAGTPFGRYTDILGVDGSDPWVTPTDGTNDYKLWFFTKASPGAVGGPGANATNPDTAGRANFTVVPEPASAALIALGMFGFAGWRRRS